MQYSNKKYTLLTIWLLLDDAWRASGLYSSGAMSDPSERLVFTSNSSSPRVKICHADDYINAQQYREAG
jgi:hypothetical protein